MDVLLVFNPQAGHMRRARLDALMQCYMEAGCNVTRIDSHDDDIVLVARANDLICVAGGDGTVRDVLARIDSLSTTTRITVYPMGTINLLAREAGYVIDDASFVARSISQKASRHYYVARVNEGPMLVCASVGPDSAAVAGVTAAMKQRYHRFAYAISAMRLLWEWRRDRVEAVVDGQRHACEAAYILNGKYYAGPWSLDKRADLRANTMQVLLLPAARRRDYLRLILATIIHPAFADPKWKRLSGSVINLSSSVPLPVQADGDITATLPVSITMASEPTAFS